jgi:serine/threonine-protein kinase PpkA
MMKALHARPALRSRCAAFACLALLTLAVGIAPVGGAEESARPLRVEGKRTLYQRVLTRLGAELRRTPEASGDLIERARPFSIYYVYDRRSGEGVDWLRLGPSSNGDTTGWVRSDQLVEWKQTLIAFFTRPGNRHPALFFDERSTLRDLLESELGAKRATDLSATLGHGSGTGEIVAREPEKYIDPSKNFYVLPILDHSEADDDFATKMLKVAVVNDRARARPEPPSPESDDDPLARFKVAIAFVIDTTLSMGPYIDQTRDAVRRICEKTQSTKWRERFNFAMIAFRDSLEASPELGYIWKKIVDFKDGRDCAALLRDAQAAEEAKISSKDFSEDAFAGVNAALTELDWRHFGGRYVVLITDSSARSANNRYSSTGLNAQQLNSKAQSQGIALLTLHLLTPEGESDHERATHQYTSLSRWPNLKSLYYPLPAGAQRLGIEVEQLADDLIAQLGREVADFLAKTKSAAPARAARSEDIDRLGHAMRLAYLGRLQGTAAPEVFEAWVAERSIRDRRKLALETRLLLTKDQLSDLQTAMRQIIEAGDLTDLAPENFFAQVRNLLIVAQRDAAELARAKTLGDPVVLGEYLEGLPYRSALTGIDHDSWLAMGAGERQEVIDDIEAKIQLYQDIHDDQDLWITLDDGHVKGDAVYPVLLSDLP